MSRTVVLWFRRDLRLSDNAALRAALNHSRPVVALYIPESLSAGQRPPGAASRWWLHHSLSALRAGLRDFNISLVLRRGDPRLVVPQLAAEIDAAEIVCNTVHEPAEQRIETEVAARLRQMGRNLNCFEGSLIRPPGTILNQSGRPYRVFTPYWNSWRQFQPELPHSQPQKKAAAYSPPLGEDLASWNLTPTRPDWAGGLRHSWTPGECGAKRELESFLTNTLGDYGRSRDIPGEAGTSRLSAHLHFGELSPHQIYHAVRSMSEASDKANIADNGWKFIRQLCWREFNHDLLAQHPTMATANINSLYDSFPWRDDSGGLEAWRNGQTGYPIVDAGMRELWATGVMHNRVRMIVASFLVKHLLVHWREGEAWFWDTLVDADLANNAANWQWVAGSGVDAAPYYRIFNPTRQGERFDPEGIYVRQWVPERADYSPRDIHKPTAQSADLFKSDYPPAIVDHTLARTRALAAFKSLKSETSDA